MYTTNPRMPKLRARAVNMVLSGKSVSSVARYFGYSKSAVSKWCQKSPDSGIHYIPTKSSRPHHHPKELSEDVVEKIIEYKKKYDRCSEVVHQHLLKDGIKVSLNSVRRKIDQAKAQPLETVTSVIKASFGLETGRFSDGGYDSSDAQRKEKNLRLHPH